MICAGLSFFGMIIDFFTILFTGSNFPFGTTIPGSSIYWDCFLAWMWVAPIYILGIYFGIALLMPKKKWYFMPFYVVLGIIYEICIFLDFEGSVALEYPANQGENIIEGTYVVGSPVFIILVIFTLSLLMFGFRIFIKGIQSTGVLRKKYLLLAFGIVMATTGGILEGLVPIGIASIFIRIEIISSYWLWYLALREEPEKTKKVRPKKEVTVKESLFRISKRPDHLTEEEVSISKEKKICLVCKGKATGVTYVCTECEAFYCMNCAQAISNLENACWVCNAPIDPSKPVKPFKKEEETVDLEILKKYNKTPQKPK